MDVGVSGGGVMTGEPSAALCAAIAARILRSASAAAAARCDAVLCYSDLLSKAQVLTAEVLAMRQDLTCHGGFE